MLKSLLALTLSLTLCGAISASELIEVKGKTLGRENHQFIYEDKNACKSCHVSGKKSTTDQACVDCHGTIDTIKIDPKNLVNSHANPHASVHYDTAISCIACHAEHEKKAPLCAECHRSWFKEM